MCMCAKSKGNHTLNSRDRLLQLIEVMQKESDRDNPLSLNEIIDKMQVDVDLNKDTLSLDLKALQTSELLQIDSESRIGRETVYWYEGIGLELHELRLLLDAVVAARFIPHKETRKLVDQLKRFSGKRITDEMDSQIYIADEPGVAIQQIGYSIPTLHEAVQSSKIIQFQYGKYNTDKEFVLNRNGDYYEMKPYGLIWSQDFYYLIAQSVDQPIMKHFRVDRMREVTLTDCSFAKEPGFEMNKYLKKLFHMYSGEDIDIVVEFDNHLINVVIDRFGPTADVRPQENGRFQLFTKGIYSDGLVRWLLTWGSDAKVLHPPKLVERMKEETMKFYNIYHCPTHV